MNSSVSTGTIIPIEVVPLINRITSELVTGATNIKAKIRRQSDGLILDWDDMTFKASPVTQLLQDMVEVDATNFPGEYSYNFDPSLISNYVSNDSYFVTVIEDGTSVIGNLPQSGQVDISLAQDEAILARKLVDNKHTLSDGDTNNMVIYDNDKTSILRIYNVKDKSGGPIVIGNNVPASREPI